MRYSVLVSTLLVVLVISLTAAAQQIRGDYLETRSADVYTGQCFANGEVNLVGNEAILAWHVQSGTWNGVPLGGLSVAAAVRQRVALEDFAHHMGGKLLEHVERVIAAPVQFEVSEQQHGFALLRAGQFATVQTRSLGDKDHLCGNEVTFYPPLTELAHSMPAVAVTDQYRGPGLGVSWDLHGKRSAFIGSFAR